MAINTLLKNFSEDIKNTFQARKSITDVAAKYLSDLSEESFGVTPEQMEAVTGDLDDLTTTTKTNLVAAVNEVNSGVGTNASAISDIQEYLGKIETGAAFVDISGYTSTNQYTAPADGYINAYANGSGNYAYIIIKGKNADGASISLSVDGSTTDAKNRVNGIFIRKGMKVYLADSTGTIGTNILVRYIPLE